jgi:hypothetical protein
MTEGRSTIRLPSQDPRCTVAAERMFLGGLDGQTNAMESFACGNMNEFPCTNEVLIHDNDGWINHSNCSARGSALHCKSRRQV